MSDPTQTTGASASRRLSLAAGLVLLASLAYAVVLSLACYEKYRGVAYGDFDLAVHAQSVWNILHGSVDSSIFGISFLGNHMVLILFLVAPLYAVFMSPAFLLVLQTVLLASGAWFVFLIGRRLLPEGWAAALALIYLVYPPLTYLNLYEFHPIALSVPFLLAALYGFEAEQFKRFLLALGLAMACQENLCLVAVGFSLFALVRRRRGPWLWAPAAIGIAYLVLVFGFILPRFNPGIIQFTKLYEPFGSTLPQIAGTMGRHPFVTAGSLVAPHKLTFYSALLAPLGYVSLLSPLSLLPGALLMLQKILSTRLSEFTILYHYQAEYIPFIFFAAIHGTRRVLAIRHPAARTALGVVLVALPLFSLWGSHSPHALANALRTRTATNPRELQAAARMLAAIPAEARVMTTFTYQPPLANRRHLYSLHHVYDGRYTLSNVPYPAPDVDALILDTGDPLTFGTDGFYAADGYCRLQALMKDRTWTLDSMLDRCLVLRRVAPGAAAGQPLPFRVLDAPPEPDGLKPAECVSPSISITLLGWKPGAITGPSEDPALDCALFWQVSSNGASDCDIRLTVSSAGRELYSGRLSPGKRLWPPQSWPAGAVVEDRYRIRMPMDMTHTPTNLECRVEIVPLAR